MSDETMLGGDVPKPTDSGSAAEVTPDQQLTNKQKRLAKKEEKAKQREAEKTGEKRKRKESTKEDNAVDGEGETAAAEDGAEQDAAETEEQPLSHKEQRKRRKLEKQAKARGETLEVDHVKGNGAATSSLPARSPYSIWIGNLSFKTSPQRIQEWLEENEIQGISRVHMPKGVRKGEYNKGFTYIDLPSQEVVEEAIKLSESHLDGRRLLIKSGSDFNGRPAIDPDAAVLAAASLGSAPASEGAADGGAVVTGKTGLTKTAAKILRTQKNPPAPTLFVGNLPFEATEEGLRELLEDAAKARMDKFAKDRNPNQKSKKKKGKARKEAKEGAEEGSEAEAAEDSDDSSSSSDEEDDEKEKENAEGDDSQDAEQKRARGSGIRKIRMGTFEDAPTKCKGFAFVDFHTTAHATASLIDYPRCYRLLGRTLILQYASAEAVRRGAPKGERVGRAIENGRAKKKSRPGKAERKAVAASKPVKLTGANAEVQAEAPADVEMEELAKNAPAPGTFDPNAPLPKKHKETQEERKARREQAKQGKRPPSSAPSRPKPGAALANAQRATQSIVPSQGKKITF